MKARLQNFVLFLLAILTCHGILAQSAYQDVDIPNLTKGPEENIYQFSINTYEEENSLLVISSRSEVTIFVDNQLIYHVTNDSIPISTLGEGILKVKVFTTETPELRLLRANQTTRTVGDSLVRESRGFNNFLSLYVSLIVGFLAVLKVLRARDLVEMFRVDTMFSPRNKDENILRNKIVSTSNVLFFSFFALLASGIIVIVTSVLQHLTGPFSFFLGQWLLWLLNVLIFLILKFLIISFFVYLFNLKNFLVFHLINYLRISMFFAALWLTVIVFIIWFDGGETMILWVVSSLIVSMLFRTLIIFFKLINEANYRLFHLFSYLCGTEILPIFWVILLVSYLF